MTLFSPSESERLTRKTLIDPKLRAAGWRIVPFEDAKPLASYDRCAIEEYPTDNGPARDLAGNTLDQLALGPVDLGRVHAPILPDGSQLAVEEPIGGVHGSGPVLHS